MSEILKHCQECDNRRVSLWGGDGHWREGRAAAAAQVAWLWLLPAWPVRARGLRRVRDRGGKASSGPALEVWLACLREEKGGGSWPRITAGL